MNRSKCLQDGPLSEPLDLLIHLPRKHQSEHLEIAQEGPERVAEGGGDVAFDEEVAVPSEAVAEDEGKDEEPPVEEDEEADQQERACEGAQEMPAPRRGLGVLGDVVRPELFKASENHFPCLSFLFFSFPTGTGLAFLMMMASVLCCGCLKTQIRNRNLRTGGF